MNLITGATGFLGRELLGRLLVSRPGERFYLLLRPGPWRDSSVRARNLLKEIFGPHLASDYSDRVVPLSGDLEEPFFGWGEAEFRTVAADLRSVFHCAASTSLNQNLEAARRINVCGTEQVLHLAQAAGKHSGATVHHISTAYVAGNTDAVVRAGDLDLRRGFRNAYEQSKAEAEILVNNAEGHVRVLIYRPSIIVGDSVTGQTSAFNVLYIPVRFVVNGLLKVLPATPHAPFDVVPVDYVADAISLLSAMDQESGTCYHLSAGVGRESSPLEIIELFIKTLRAYSIIHLIPPPFISQELILKARNSLFAAADGLMHWEKKICSRFNVFRRTLPLIPYMLSNPRFDNRETTRDLDGLLSLPPLFANYAESIFAYCLETNWGKIPWANPKNLKNWPQRLTCPCF